MKNQKGFSLIELLIVVVIIGIIAAIAIPNLLASRRASNEGSAIASLRTYHGAQISYQATTGAGNYAGMNGANAFEELASVNLLDEVLGSGYKSGYRFIGASYPAQNGNPAAFMGVAIPTVPLAQINNGGGGGPVLGFAFLQVPLTEEGGSSITATGTRVFAIATDGVIYYDGTQGDNFDMNFTGGEDGALEITGGTPLEGTPSAAPSVTP